MRDWLRMKANRSSVERNHSVLPAFNATGTFLREKCRNFLCKDCSALVALGLSLNFNTPRSFVGTPSSATLLPGSALTPMVFPWKTEHSITSVCTSIHKTCASVEFCGKELVDQFRFHSRHAREDPFPVQVAHEWPVQHAVSQFHVTFSNSRDALEFTVYRLME